MKKSKKYKVAIIGCGKIAIEEGNYCRKVQPGTHAGAFSLHPQIEIVGFADIDPKRLKVASKKFPDIPLFISAEEMIKKTQPDIVSIATHTNTHAALVKLAAKYKIKAIVCEKPMAENIQKAKKMIAACRASNSLLFINHTRRFDPLFIKLKKEIGDGIIGQVVQGSYFYYNGIFNNGTHAVDLMRFFLGDIDWVVAVENKLAKNLDLPHLRFDLNVDALLHFKNGAAIHLHPLPANYGFSDIYLFGTKGSIFLKEMNYKIEYRKLINNKYFKGYYGLEEKAVKKGDLRSYMKSLPVHVVDCLEGGSSPISRGEDGLEAIKILSLLKKSALAGGKKIKVKDNN